MTVFGDNNLSGAKIAKVKICGINALEDLELCVSCGADALGFLVYAEEREEAPSRSGHRLDWKTASRLIKAVPPYVASVLLVHVSTRDAIAELCQRFSPRAIQIQTDVSEQDLAFLRQQFPNIGFVKTVHVYPESSFDEVISDITKHLASGIIDAVNLDSKKSRASAQTGGTGLVHDWNITSSVVRRFRSTPVILAGGLTSENVRRAVETVQPYAVDVMSGVELEGGEKSPDRVRSFFAALSEK